MFFTLLILETVLLTEAKRAKTAVITDVNDIKEFKKLLRTKTNVLVLYVNNYKNSPSIIDVFKDAADLMKGQATLVIMDCTNRYVFYIIFKPNM